MIRSPGNTTWARISGCEAISGIFAILFGVFGVRRTVEQLVDSMDAVHLPGVVLEAISNIDL